MLVRKTGVRGSMIVRTDNSLQEVPPKHCGDAPRPYRGNFGSTPDGGSFRDSSEAEQLAVNQHVGVRLPLPEPRRFAPRVCTARTPVPQTGEASSTLAGSIAPLAHLEERLLDAQEARGSTPLRRTPRRPDGEGACMVGRKARVRLPDGARRSRVTVWDQAGLQIPPCEVRSLGGLSARRHRRLGEPAGLQNPTVRFDSGRCLCCDGATDSTPASGAGDSGSSPARGTGD